MAKTKDDAHRGYRARFDAAGQTVRELSTFSACPGDADGGCGLPMEVHQTWRRSDVPDRTLYRIMGVCPTGHVIERYGYGEAVG